MPVKLGIVIGTYNRLPQLKRCLQAILGQLSISHEVWVIDAGSTDGTAAYLRELPGIIPVFDGAPIGQGKSLNNAFRRLQAQYALWLSDDNVAIPRVIEKAVRALDRNPELGMIGLKTKDVSGPFASSAFIGGISSAGILNVNQGVVRLDVFREVGFFSEEFRDYGIDTDLTAKILLAGYKVAYTKQIAVHHDRAWMNLPDSADYREKILRQEKATMRYDEKYGFLREVFPFPTTKKLLGFRVSLIRPLERLVLNAYWLRSSLGLQNDGRLKIEEVANHCAGNYSHLSKNGGRLGLFSKAALSHNPKKYPPPLVFFRNLAYFFLSPYVKRRAAGKNFRVPLSNRALMQIPLLGWKLLDLRRSLDNVVNARFISAWDPFRSIFSDYYLVQSIPGIPRGFVRAQGALRENVSVQSN